MIQSTFFVNDENEKSLYKKTFYNEIGFKSKEVDYDRNLIEEIQYTYNSIGLLINETLVIDGLEVSSQHFEYDDNENIVFEEHFVNGLVVFERIKNFQSFESCIEKVFKYDIHGNELSFELKKCNGVLLEFYYKKYDELHRIIEEKGAESMTHDSGYSDIRGLKKFHFIHTYNTIE